jgi:hypothetical protein
MNRRFGHRVGGRRAGLAAVVMLVGAGMAGHAAAAPARQQAPVPLTVFFLADDSNGLAGATLSGMDSRSAIKKGAEVLMDQLDMGRDRAAVVLFGDTAVLAQGPTHDRQAVIDGLEKLTMRDSLARLDHGYNEVRKAIMTDTASGEMHYATVTITDGPFMEAPELALARAQGLTRQGVRHYTIAVGTIAQYGLLRQIAEPNGAFEFPAGGDIVAAYEQIGKILAGLATEPWPTPYPTGTRTLRPTAYPTDTRMPPETGTPLPTREPLRPIFLPLAWK